ncbi:MAG TPA: hypothetical protein DGD08_06540 [Gemmatimonas aurantiaca]|uniref:Uncharacterized protein n=2 Tax=Gemmatimonas aurantiaca TaxID=173480 RepID=C1A772_GEMAT|nr:hypothetical protein [Gemmatimonas aurantiaca]BAH38082.1 hypothetical protein GAU_1040 [Gemmatimonas aurantiaca T-27]HCT56856.1 hypothetical protein [Gemmatimonas aurantiaca]
MEQAGSWGNWIAQGAIVLFLVLLLALVIRTSMMFGSVVLLAITGRKGTGQLDASRDPSKDTPFDRASSTPTTPPSPPVEP